MRTRVPLIRGRIGVRWPAAAPLLSPPLLAIVLAGCASDVPFSTELDESAGSVAVEILGDGFVRSGGRRIPLERLVLELRQRTRAMSDDERSRFAVKLRIAAGIEEGAAAKIARDGHERLLKELEIMRIGYVMVS